jgi:undecaprenyl-diphosphatase
MLDAINAIDVAILRWVVSTLRAAWLDPMMIVVSAVGLYGAIFVAVGAAATWCWQRRWTMMALWRLVLAVALAQVVASSLMKPMFERERPFAADVGITTVQPVVPTTSSMPSGHAATAVAGAIALSLLWPAGRALAWLLAFAIIASRLYLGVHYPTDVLAGAIVGWACAMVATARTPAGSGLFASHFARSDPRPAD